jgi:hypothetical protein
MKCLGIARFVFIIRSLPQQKFISRSHTNSESKLLIRIISHGHDPTWNHFRRTERKSWNIYHQKWQGGELSIMRQKLSSKNFHLFRYVPISSYFEIPTWSYKCLKYLMMLIVMNRWWVWKPKNIPMRNLWNMFVDLKESKSLKTQIEWEWRRRCRNDHPHDDRLNAPS